MNTKLQRLNKQERCVPKPELNRCLESPLKISTVSAALHLCPAFLCEIGPSSGLCPSLHHRGWWCTKGSQASDSAPPIRPCPFSPSSGSPPMLGEVWLDTVPDNWGRKREDEKEEGEKEKTLGKKMNLSPDELIWLHNASSGVTASPKMICRAATATCWSFIGTI